jgi:hypothetical protein
MLSDLDLFIAGLPPCPLFKLGYNDLQKMVVSSRYDEIKQNSVPEVCLIALVAYFEAFFKNEFAAIVNICPQFLKSFCAKRPDTSVAIKDLISINLDSKNQLGFVLAEKYDFGSSRKINSLFFDLLNVTLFSNDESKRFDRLLNDRNLLVHHGGIYTIRYHEQTFTKQRIGNRIFVDSLNVKKSDYLKWAKFVDHIVEKTISVCYKAAQEAIEKGKIKMSKERRKAFKFLDWYE